MKSFVYRIAVLITVVAYVFVFVSCSDKKESEKPQSGTVTLNVYNWGVIFPTVRSVHTIQTQRLKNIIMKNSALR